MMRDDPFARLGAPSQNALLVDDEAWTEDELEPRPWDPHGYGLKGSVTLISGPPSALKSSLVLAWAVAKALGRPHGKFCPTTAGKVIVYNVEDNILEQRRRLSAVLRQFDAIPADIADKVIRVSPTQIGTLFGHENETGELFPTPAMNRLRQLIADRKPDMLIADPFVELHEEDENDNTALRRILAEFRSLAAEFKIVVILVHHTRKGAATPGDIDAARGASAIIGAAKIVFTLFPMSDEEAVSFAMPRDRQSRARYVRLDDGRQNYAEIENARWYEAIGYKLDNGDTVAALVPWEPPDMWDGIPTSVACKIIDEIDAGLPNGQRYSNANAAGRRAAFHVVIKRADGHITEKQARKAIQTWIDNQVLVERAYDDPVVRKTRQGLFANPARRPGENLRQ
jgi:hypothetical protein